MSSRKNTIKTYTLADAQSLAASFQTVSTSVERLDRVCLYIDVKTSDAVGNVSVQSSIDNETWVDLPLGLVSIAGADQDYFIDLQVTSIPWVRVAWTRTSGTGTLTAKLSAKES